jgi:hypothetical protein
MDTPRACAFRRDGSMLSAMARIVPVHAEIGALAPHARAAGAPRRTASTVALAGLAAAARLWP